MKMIKKITSIVLASILFFSIGANTFAIKEPDLIDEGGFCTESEEPCSTSWKLYSNGILEINGMGPADGFNDYFDYKYLVKEIAVNEGVTSIPFFNNWSSLEKVSLPNTVKEIKCGQFNMCTNLSEISFGNELESIEAEAFSYTGLKNIVIPASVETIPEYLFAYCSELESVVMENGVKYISDAAFALCAKLKSVSIPASVESIGQFAFVYDFNLTDVSIDSQNEFLKMVDGCIYSKDGKSLLAVPGIKRDVINISKDVEKIEIENIEKINNGFNVDKDNAFYYSKDGLLYERESKALVSVPYYRTEPTEIWNECKNINIITSAIEELTVDSTSEYFKYENGFLLTKDGKEIKYVSQKLKEMTIPEGVTQIDTEVFFNCNNLETLNIPSTLKWINMSDEYFNALKRVNVSNNNPYLSSVDGVLYDKDKTYLMFLPKEKNGKLVLPDTVEYLHGVSKNNKISEVDLGASVVDVDYSWDFDNCKKYSVSEDNSKYASVDGVLFSKDKTKLYKYPAAKSGSYSVPDGTITIDSYSFNDAVKLTSIELPSSISNIYSDFTSCTSLDKVLFNGTIEQWCSVYSNEITAVAGDLYIDGNVVDRVEVDCNVTSKAFIGCKSIKSVHLGKNATLSYWCFQGCSNIEYYEVDSENEKYYVKNGVLYDDESDYPIAYPAGKNEPFVIVYLDGETSLPDVFDVQLPSDTTTIIIDNSEIMDGNFYQMDGFRGTVCFTNEITTRMVQGYYDNEFAWVFCYYDKCILPTRNMITTLNEGLKYKEPTYYSSDIFSSEVDDEIKKYRELTEIKIKTLTQSVFDDIKVTYADDVLDDSAVKIETMSLASINNQFDYLSVNTYDGNTYTPVYAFSINSESQPNGDVWVQLEIPSSLVGTDFAVMHFLSDKEGDFEYLTKENGKLIYDDENHVTLILNHFSDIVFATVSETNVQNPEILTPSMASINKGFGIVLHASFDLPENYSVKWIADNNNFDMTDNGDGTCTITSVNNGETLFHVMVIDEKGNEVQDKGTSVKLNSNASFFQKILYFFRNLFGLLKIYDK